ncbi:MAG: NAD(P)/FAD-dependent oxidoreductase [Planctomycetaceae bacterium]
MTDCCIIGGGIVGLSIARELAGRGHRVRVLTREGRRDTASWAAAGILPPAPDHAGCTPNERLTAWSDRLHREWADDLRRETGIDNGLRICGGVHVCRDERGRDRLLADAANWRSRGAACEWLEANDVAAVEPALAAAVARAAVTGGFLLPEEIQIRPPRHLEALERSCDRRGVTITRGATVREIVMSGGRVDRVEADVGGSLEEVRAGVFVLAAGAWSGLLGKAVGIAIDTRPIRGQIVQFAVPDLRLVRVVNRGLDYLVPRADGTLLAGSTLEDVGFDTATDEAAIARLAGVVRDLLGDQAAATPQRSWAGLRPGSHDGLPTIGPVPGCGNAFVAAGHFRAGLHQSPGTALLIADLVEGRTPPLDPTPFAVDRPPQPPTKDSVAALLARSREA